MDTDRKDAAEKWAEWFMAIVPEPLIQKPEPNCGGALIIAHAHRSISWPPMINGKKVFPGPAVQTLFMTSLHSLLFLQLAVQEASLSARQMGTSVPIILLREKCRNIPLFDLKETDLLTNWAFPRGSENSRTMALGGNKGLERILVTKSEGFATH